MSSGPIRFGIALDHQYERGDDLSQRVDECVELVELARDLGFGSVFGIHHYLAPLSTFQPLTLLARLIPNSGDMMLGTGIYIASLNHPVHMAEEVATLDQLSGGRVLFGIGAGYRDEEFNSFGIDRRTRGERVLEAVAVMKGLWSDSEFSYQGQHYEIQAQRISMPPRRPGGPPILVGATTPHTIRRAAGFADTWLSTFSHKIRWAAGHLKIFQEALEEQGRSPLGREYPIQRELFLADSHEEAVALAEPYLKRSYGAYAPYSMSYLEDMFEDLRNKAFLLGTPERITERLQEHVEAGFNHFIFRVQWLGMPKDMARRTLERFAHEVMPHFATSRADAEGGNPL